MTYIPNSIEARDVASLVHMQTNLRKHQQEGPLVIVRGEGCRVFDDSGRDYIESVAGLWCASLGFGSERLARVAYEQMRKLGYYQTYRSASNDPTIDLAEKLLKLAPVPMSKVLLQCSGSEANDTAIKLIWYYHHAIGKPDKKKIIGRMQGYHGNTVAAASLSGKPAPAPALMNICYSLVTPDYGISTTDVYQVAKDKGIVPTPNAGGLSVKTPTDLGERKLEAAYARGWYRNISADTWG